MKALVSDKCVKFSADKTREFSVPTDAVSQGELLLARERGRLARQLHDEAASAMFAARLKLDLASKLAEQDSSRERLLSALDDATSSANEALASVRRICAELKEFGRESVNLFGDLTEVLRAFERKTGAQCLLSVGGNCPVFEPEAAARILRIVRGKLAEAALASGVTRVRVDILASEFHYGLKIRIQALGELLERPNEEDVLRPETKPGSSRAGQAAATMTSGVARKSTFAVKIPRVS